MPNILTPSPTAVSGCRLDTPYRNVVFEHFMLYAVFPQQLNINNAADKIIQGIIQGIKPSWSGDKICKSRLLNFCCYN